MVQITKLGGTAKDISVAKVGVRQSLLIFECTALLIWYLQR